MYTSETNDICTVWVFVKKKKCADIREHKSHKYRVTFYTGFNNKKKRKIVFLFFFLEKKRIFAGFFFLGIKKKTNFRFWNEEN